MLFPIESLKFASCSRLVISTALSFWKYDIISPILPLIESAANAVVTASAHITAAIDVIFKYFLFI